MKKILGKSVALAVVGAVSYGAFLVAPSVSAEASDTTINSTIGSVLSVFSVSPATVDVSVTPTSAGAQSIASNAVTVSTNGPGYTLQINNKDNNTSLVSGSNNITAASGSQTTPAALTAGTWGYRVDGVGGFGAGPTNAVSNGALSTLTFAGVPASGAPNTIRNTSAAATNEVTTFWYSVAANTSQPSGVYTDIVTYTALAK